jgi:hypothetical protein
MIVVLIKPVSKYASEPIIFSQTLIRNRYFSIVFFKSPTFEVILYNLNIMHIQGNTNVLTCKFDLTNVNNMAFYISGPKLLFETTEISTYPNSTKQESNYIYLYTTKFGTSIKIRLNRKFESTEFETMRVNCISCDKLVSDFLQISGFLWIL